jgi:methyltransferase (TIGR00027 family)
MLDEMMDMQDSSGNSVNSESGGKDNGPNMLAERIALIRAGESARPEGERVCYDPYAARFVGPEMGKLLALSPEQRDTVIAQLEQGFPGLTNSTISRVRFFDDLVSQAVADGLKQLIILGAGYDTRAYRIKGIEKVKVFEVDQAATLAVKMNKVREIFGKLPQHVTYIALDLEADSLADRLKECGYDPSKKTFFAMEGLLMYLDHRAVDRLLAFITHNSGKGSAIAFDYGRLIQESSSNKDRDMAVAIAQSTESQGGTMKFGIIGTVEKFLAERGFANVTDMDSGAYKKAYFHGKNAGRQVNSLLRLAYAEIK